MLVTIYIHYTLHSSVTAYQSSVEVPIGTLSFFSQYEMTFIGHGTAEILPPVTELWSWGILCSANVRKTINGRIKQLPVPVGDLPLCAGKVMDFSAQLWTWSKPSSGTVSYLQAPGHSASSYRQG